MFRVLNYRFTDRSVLLPQRHLKLLSSPCILRDHQSHKVCLLHNIIFSKRQFSSLEAALTDDDSRPDVGLFENMTDLHPVTKAALRSQKIEKMTEIQIKTWGAAIDGQDVLGRSRTGSGKTLAFVLPSLERILRLHKPGDNRIKMLIVSPTRELAHQIFEATQKLTLKFGKDKISPLIKCQVVYGGIPKQKDIQKMVPMMPTILTATPGRLLDHLESSRIGNVPFRDSVKDIEILVLDEMDRLLDMGFRDDLESVLKYLSKPSPTRQRQTLLFSATMPKGVSQMIKLFVRRDHAVVDCIQDDDPSSHTVNTVEQSHVVLPMDKLVAGVVQTILHLMKSDNRHKIIVFFPTTSQVAYFSSLFNAGLGYRVLQIHSRISQGTRMNTSDRFRHAKTASVLFTSDVSARGVDYPNVTHVIQVGAASDRETYIHRLGRTGRAGKSGQGIILLMDTEAAFLKRDLHDIQIPINSKLQNLMDTKTSSISELEDDMTRLRQAIRPGSALEENAKQVYISLFGYYMQRFKLFNIRNPNDAIVEFVNSFASQAGLKELPSLSLNLAKQYGLERHPGIKIRKTWDTGGMNFDVGRHSGKREMDRGRNSGRPNFNVGTAKRGDDSRKPEWAGWVR